MGAAPHNVWLVSNVSIHCSNSLSCSSRAAAAAAAELGARAEACKTNLSNTIAEAERKKPSPWERPSEPKSKIRGAPLPS